MLTHKPRFSSLQMRIDSAQKQLVSTVNNKRQMRYVSAGEEGELLLLASQQMILRANLAAHRFLSAPKPTVNSSMQDQLAFGGSMHMQDRGPPNDAGLAYVRPLPSPSFSPSCEWVSP